MAKTAAPSLDSHDGSLGLNDAELEGSLETVAGISVCGLDRQMTHRIRLSTSVCQCEEGTPRGSG